MIELRDENEKIHLLKRLGFTRSEARIYLTLNKLGESSASKISKTAQVDRAETYRAICKLEKKGYVLRTVGCPCTFEAIPVSDLLHTLLKNKKNEISDLESSATKILLPHSQKDTEAKRDNYIKIVPKIETVLHKITTGIFETEHFTEIDIVTTKELLQHTSPMLMDQTIQALERGVKYRFIIEKPRQKSHVSKLIKTYVQYPNFRVRYKSTPIKVPLAIHDDKDIWIKISHEKDHLTSSWLVSNNKHIVALTREYFDLIFKNATPIQKNTRKTGKKLIN